MKIFVIGASHSGKSPFAGKVAAALGIPCYGASAWVRERFPGVAGDRAAFVEAITSFALAELRRDPAISIDHLRARADLDAPCVIEGIRNPFDFVHCFDARSDRVVHLHYTGEGALPPTVFERGIDVIGAYLDWLRATGLLDHERVTEIRLATFAELDTAIAAYVATLPSPPTDPDRHGAVATVHAEIPPLRTHVRAEYLYGMDPSRAGETRPCAAFSISSYAGSAPTFQILLGDGAMFSYLPADALVDPDKLADPLELADLVYHDCKSTAISVHDFAALHGPVLCWFKRVDRWVAGTYQFTVDWHTTNEMLHCIALANGQYALLPSHKIKFGDHPPGFEPYRKIRREWKVTPADSRADVEELDRDLRDQRMIEPELWK